MLHNCFLDIKTVRLGKTPVIISYAKVMLVWRCNQGMGTDNAAEFVSVPNSQRRKATFGHRTEEAYEKGGRTSRVRSLSWVPYKVAASGRL